MGFLSVLGREVQERFQEVRTHSVVPRGYYRRHHRDCGRFRIGHEQQGLGARREPHASDRSAVFIAEADMYFWRAVCKVKGVWRYVDGLFRHPTAEGATQEWYQNGEARLQSKGIALSDVQEVKVCGNLH